MSMNLPFKFTSDSDVIVEEAARFRALSPEARAQSIHGLLAAGMLLMRRSPKESFLREYSVAQENLAQHAVKEFLSRHVE